MAQITGAERKDMRELDARFHTLTGEFRNPQEEETFLLAAWAGRREILWMFHVTTVLATLICAGIDLAILGFSRSFGWITLTRFAVLLPLWLMYRWSRSPATYRALDYVPFPYAAALFLIIFTSMRLSPESRVYGCAFLVAGLASVACIDIISFRTVALILAISTVTFLAGLALLDGYTVVDVLGTALALTVFESAGLARARHSKRLTREHFLLRRDAEAAHAGLERAYRQLAEREQELAHLVATDALTGVLARREFLSRASIELQRARRSRETMGLLMLDIDHFKSINDRHGHATGDAALIVFATALGRDIRPGDSIGRLGGEEFAVLLPNASEPEICRIAERLREQVATTVLPLDHDALRFTVSIGAASLASGDDGIDRLIARADEALYAAKQGGRNRVVVAAQAGARNTG